MSRRRLHAVLTAAAAATTLVAAAPGAHAAISGTTVLAPLSTDVLSAGSAALADDGTGGVVWLQRDAGRPHVFAARYTRGVWGPAQRVDGNQPYAASWPVIAAGDNGRLLVAWVEEYGPGSDRLYAAQVSPGSSSFGLPTGVDLDVNEATGTQPSLAMNRGGAALIAYRVITAEPSDDPTLQTGTQDAEFRIARYKGRRWSSLGRANRNISIPVPAPAAGNGPQIGIDQDGNGVVGWVEDDNMLVPRVWARRVFASSLGPVLQASPATEPGGAPAGAGDAFALSIGQFGDAALAFRQEAGPQDADARAHAGVTTLGQTTFTGAGALTAVQQPPDAIDAPPAVSMGSQQTFRLGLSVAGGLAQVASTQDGLAPAAVFGAGSAAQVAEGRDGSASLAWSAGTGVGVQQRTSTGVRSAALSAPAGGAVSGLEGAGDGLGDQLLTWRQGDAETGAIAAAAVDAPPSTFALHPPAGWVQPSAAKVAWDAALDAMGPVTYDVLLDGVAVVSGVRSDVVRLPADRLDDGKYVLRVRATDRAGQQQLSLADQLKVDGTPPRVTIKRLKGRVVSVGVADGKGTSGADPTATRITFGDGKRSSGSDTVRHRYGASKTYKIVVRVADNVGNAATVTRRVAVR